MMSESLDSRKFERKPMFDVPLPMRRAQRPQTAGSDGSENDGTATPPSLNTMAFSLMTKKGTKPQVSFTCESFCTDFGTKHFLSDPNDRDAVRLPIRGRNEKSARS